MKIENKKMKYSGVEWIGRIPSEWEVARIGSVYKLRNSKVSDYDYMPLSVTMNGVVPQLDNAAKTNAHEDRKLVLKGDFAINSRSDRRGACGISDYNGSVSLINTVITPIENMSPRYYNWIFHTEQFADEFYKWGHGIVDDLWTTSWQEMKNINITMPNIEEQNKIANFLDEKCSKIDKVIKDINQQIETLENYKKSLINDLVTGKKVLVGVKLCDPEKTKDSGIPWINKVPENWNVIRFKYIVNSFYKGNGITKEDACADGDIPCVRYGEIYSKYSNSFEKCFSRTFINRISMPQYFNYGDILFACTGEKIEEIGKNIVYLGKCKCLAGGDILIATHSQNPIFLNYLLNSDFSQTQKSIGRAKLKVVHIYKNDIENIYIAIPNIEEQNRIADFLDEKCSKIDNIINQKKNQIDTLEKYKKSLIYEYVTGKKQVMLGGTNE